METRSAKVVDLFCGAGGLTYGLELAGLHVVEGVDIDPACQYPYEANTHARYVQKNARDYQADELRRAWGDAEYRVLVGCAPCQPFSTYTQGPRATYKTKWVLLNKFADLVVETEPDIVSMENVTPLERTPTFRKFVRRLRQNGYHVSHSILDCRQYGAPQMRRRLVLLASRLGPISVIDPTHPAPEDWTTVKDAISALPPIDAGAVDASDPLHKSSRLSEINLRRIRASNPGGTWKDWPEDLVAKCHRKETGKTYPGVYGRMEWEKPSPTITGQSFGFGNGRFGHPEQDRALSLREAAILQTFPTNYLFVQPNETPSMKTVGRMIGNAVPPILGKTIGLSVAQHLAAFGK
ncbi:DNA cytosine methyltransferase [Hyphomonas pacifica]|uniref:DNA (cytosine-5-)-methyltransferase n=1 Tax=Hyphomonas pacifica TaxID=1280941 RepID=A0A062TYX5_9PROT|nr:DNA cytosine methyltransferase [Hyphomonas pacifica]KCZ51227.1 hypothetical protein HY2_11775 [Hyphomonas pacifica]RAN33510.1 hypothetical protein HY3_12685 [Hyphomonas pacifica]